MNVRSLAVCLTMLLPTLGCSAEPDFDTEPLADSEDFRAANDPTVVVHLLSKQKILPTLIIAFVQDTAALQCGVLDDVCEGPDGQGGTKGTVCTECSLACTGSRQPDGSWMGAGDCAEKKKAGADTHNHTHKGKAFPKMVIEYTYDIESKEIEQATVGGEVAGANGADPDLFVERRVVWKYTLEYTKVTLWLNATDSHVLKKPKPLTGEYSGCLFHAGTSCGGTGTGTSTGTGTGTGTSTTGTSTTGTSTGTSTTGTSTGTSTTGTSTWTSGYTGGSDEGGTGGSASETGGCEWGLETGVIETSTGDSGAATGS